MTTSKSESPAASPFRRVEHAAQPAEVDGALQAPEVSAPEVSAPRVSAPRVSAPRVGRPLAEATEADRRAARQLLAAVFVTAGIVHLTHQRFYRSILPFWLLQARSEMDLLTGTAEVFGGVVLLAPRLRKLARWTNLAVLAPPLLAAVGEARYPARLRPFSKVGPGLNPLGPLVLSPGHVAMAALLWWATGSSAGSAAETAGKSRRRDHPRRMKPSAPSL